MNISLDSWSEAFKFKFRLTQIKALLRCSRLHVCFSARVIILRRNLSRLLSAYIKLANRWRGVYNVTLVEDQSAYGMADAEGSWNKRPAKLELKLKRGGLVLAEYSELFVIVRAERLRTSKEFGAVRVKLVEDSWDHRCKKMFQKKNKKR